MDFGMTVSFIPQMYATYSSNFIYCVCACTCKYACGMVSIWRSEQLVGVCSLLLACGFCGQNSDHQALWREWGDGEVGGWGEAHVTSPGTRFKRSSRTVCHNPVPHTLISTSCCLFALPHPPETTLELQVLHSFSSPLLLS